MTVGDEEILALPDVEGIRRKAAECGVPVLESHLCEAYRAGHIDGFSEGVAMATVRWRELSPMPCPLCGERPRVTICSLFGGGWKATVACTCHHAHASFGLGNTAYEAAKNAVAEWDETVPKEEEYLKGMPLWSYSLSTTAAAR